MRSSKRTGSSQLVKKWNKEEILQQVIAHGQISRADISKHTRLSRPCVSALVEEMMREGLLQEVGRGDSRGGRKPILLEYNYRAYAIAGAVFDGLTLEMAVADLKGKFLVRYQKRLPQPANGELVMEALAQGFEEMMRECSLESERFLGIGVGLPGVTQRGSGTVSYSPSTGWMGSPIQQTIEERLGLPVIIDNDVNMMTLGEYVRGVGVGYSSVVYLYVGTGIGSGIILDGQFYRGSREAAGEIGFMMIGPEPARRDDASGVFETHYAAPGIMNKAKGFLSDLQVGSSVIEALIRCAKEEQAEAARLLDEVYRHWAYSMANIASILNPELLILSGEMVHIDDEGVKRIQDWLCEWVPVAPELKRASLGEQAGLIGAVHSVLEAFPSTRLLDR
ncbi:ROK family transcriptional regulator [Brevibacillus composti]|uniref:ROK family transcriptional regulator n=1 Tax=Brevibacillus composti TaxID=2796470 RepID=A0A7T5EMJ8_9BACL|nr:ROK family transcriptional regulator [Brevibacillus composti]QQE75399.1 ROK family transcriptional regulator [Brevibacillus composti]QUO42425.1 ROK family transcriptional regulator [Brevibacillus composti]